MNPISTWDRLCCFKIILLVPTIPDTRSTRQSHQVGLKVNISAKARSAPATPPIAAECVDIFHQMLTNAQTIWMVRAATKMMLRNRGTLWYTIQKKQNT